MRSDTESVPTGLVLAPANGLNLEATIRRRVEYAVLEGHLSQAAIAKLKKSVGHPGGFHCWAMSEWNETLWQALTGRQAILFAETGTPYFTAEAYTRGRIHSRGLGERLWSEVPGEPWEYLLVVEPVIRVRIPKAELLSERGYSDFFWLPGTLKVSEERCQKAIQKWGSLRGMIDRLRM